MKTKKYGASALESLFKSKDTDGQKIQVIVQWWKTYQENKNGTYKWNGNSWVQQ